MVWMEEALADDLSLNRVPPRGVSLATVAGAGGHDRFVQAATAWSSTVGLNEAASRSLRHRVRPFPGYLGCRWRVSRVFRVAIGEAPVRRETPSRFRRLPAERRNGIARVRPKRVSASTNGPECENGVYPHACCRQHTVNA